MTPPARDLQLQLSESHPGTTQNWAMHHPARTCQGSIEAFPAYRKPSFSSSAYDAHTHTHTKHEKGAPLKVLPVLSMHRAAAHPYVLPLSAYLLLLGCPETLQPCMSEKYGDIMQRLSGRKLEVTVLGHEHGADVIIAGRQARSCMPTPCSLLDEDMG